MTEPTTAAGKLTTPMAVHLAAHAKHTIIPGLEAIIASEDELLAIEGQAVAAALARVRERVEGLEDHSVSGYEWDCDACDYGRDGLSYDDEDRVCPHDNGDDAAISRAAVLAIIDEEAGR